MKLFWRRGYEGVSVADLTEAMNIAPPSLYAAFGSKGKLYREVLELYQSRPGAVSIDVLEEPGTVREVVSRLLRSAVQTATELSPSSGCMIANGMLACGSESSELAGITLKLRRGLIDALARRFRRAASEGGLAADTDIEGLARYVAAIIQGISVQAHDGASRRQLERMIGQALEALP